MKTESEIKDKIIELYKEFGKSFSNQFDGAQYHLKGQAELLEWVLKDEK